ncbi:hypothetical protein [Nonomuraea antimicrobica]|uniref:hypothetical protein n=1 Tax=Nonomuraea antimicrobica TaxID=561173 RepID=UPI0031EA21EF
MQLLVSRGEHLHLCAYRLGKHLQLRCADKRGLIGDIDEALEKYAAKHQVSKRTGWIDLGRLMEAGLLRQVHAAAPERKACYALVMDLAALPDDLPKTLAEALRWHIDNPITIAKGGQTKAAVDEGLAESEVVRYGSAVARRGVPREPIMTALGCGRLHTSPYTREGLPPPQSHPSQGSRPTRRRPLFGGRDLGEEKAAALYFVKGLAPDWAQQRDGEVPSDVELAELAHLVMLLLRYMPESEARELLTWQVGTATNLCGVLRWRIGRTLAKLRRAARRAAVLRVDDDGRRHHAWLEANAARNADNAARKAEVVALARQLAHTATAPRLDSERDRLRARLEPRNAAQPPAAPSAPHPPSWGLRSNPAPNGGLDGSPRPGRLDSVIVPPPIIAVDDDGRRHAALMAANEAANAENAARRAELVAQARAIAAARTTGTAPSPADDRVDSQVDTVVRSPLQDRLADLMDSSGNKPCEPPPGQSRPAAVRVDDDGRRHQAWLEANAARNADNAARKAEVVALARQLAHTATARTAETPAEPERTLQDRLADILAKRARRW